MPYGRDVGAAPADEVDPTTAALLTAPLHAAAPGWTSRSVAALLGVSQSAVARAWAAAYRVPGDPVGDRLPARGLHLEEVEVSPGGSVLVLSAGPDPVPARPELPPGPFMRSPRRPALQALLAADLVARGRATCDRSDGRGGPGEVSATGAGPAGYVVTSRAADDPAAGRPAGPGAAPLVVADPLAWQGLLEQLVLRADATPLHDLLDLEHRLMAWARDERPGFAWSARSVPAPAAGRPLVAGAQPPRSTGQAVADDVVAVVLRRVETGQLGGGDRLTEGDLARAVRTSRGHVRDALRLLASAGLVALEPGRGAVVPTPTVADVVETYAARRALGTVVVRYAVRAPAEDLAPALAALREMLAVAGSGDAQATGDADLRFQDALAASVGLRQVPQLFRSLTAQLRLFIAVLGLDYAYSIPGMCADDEELMARVLDRDERAAVASWHRKVDDALSYMTTQLGRWSRHQPRARHSGSAGRSRPSVVSSPWPG